jgi:ClpP class serine protease
MTTPKTTPRYARFPEQELMLMHGPALAQEWPIDPRASEYDDGEDCDELPYGVDLVSAGDKRVAIVRIHGPLAQRSWWWDTYDRVEGRVYAALASSADAVILHIDSPGGAVAGCFDAVRRMQSAVAASGKPCIAFADELAASAGYAVACVASKICVPQSGVLGSVGVLQPMLDLTKAHALEGVRVEVVTSGEHKVDGHPAVKLTDAAVERTQVRVDALAEQFFAIVAQARGLTVEAVRALEGGVRLGRDCVATGLADQVTDLPGAIALAASLATTTQQQGQQPMKILLAAMGLDASASEAEAVAKYTADNIARGQELGRVLTALDAKSADEAVAKAVAFKADASEAVALRAKLAEEAKAKAVRERAEVLDDAVASGRMSPAERAEYDTPALAGIGADAIRAAVKHRPVAVAKTPISAPAPTDATALTEVERELCRAMGISEDSYLKNRAPRGEV